MWPTTPGRFRLLDSVDLAIHETGHLVVAPFGEFLRFAGGTLFQVLFPVLFVASMWRAFEHASATPPAPATEGGIPVRSGHIGAGPARP